MAAYVDPKQCLPSSYKLPDSDDTPVDNVDRRASRSVIQNWIPNLLLQILAIAWAERTDWFFGVDMGIYYDPDQPAVVPDGFLSLGVDRYVGEKGRLSYVFWEEDNIPPTLALEVVSKTYGGEYTRKNGVPTWAMSGSGFIGMTRRVSGCPHPRTRFSNNGRSRSRNAVEPRS